MVNEPSLKKQCVSVLPLLFYFVTGLQPLDAENFQLQKDGTYSGLQAYKNSKLCNVLFTYMLNERLKATNARVTVNSVDPGKNVLLLNMYKAKVSVYFISIKDKPSQRERPAELFRLATENYPIQLILCWQYFLNLK